VRRMAVDAAVESGGDVAAAFEALGRAIEHARGEGARLRADDGAPADGEADGDGGKTN